MNLQSIVVVALRLLALNFVVETTVQLGPKVFELLRLYRTSSRQEYGLETALPWSLLIGIYAFAVLMWVFALPVARIVTRRLPQDVSLGAISLAECYSVVFIGLGLYYSTSNLPQVLSWSHYFLKAAASTPADPWKETVNYSVISLFLQFAMGIVLFVNGRTWALRLARRHSMSAVNPPLQPTADGSSREGSQA